MRKLIWILSCLAWLSWAGGLDAGQPKPPEDACGQIGACDVCGCAAPCKKVCRLVCETKKVEETVWEVQCEEFCPLLPKIFGKKCGCGQPGCGQDPATCGGCEPNCGKEPRCSKPQVKKTLVKKTITREVPVYRCVVEHVCGGCCGAEPAGAPAAPAAPAQKAAPAPVPPPPPPAKPAPKAAFRPVIQPTAAIPEAPEQHEEAIPREEPLPRLVLGG